MGIIETRLYQTKQEVNQSLLQRVDEVRIVNFSHTNCKNGVIGLHFVILTVKLYTTLVHFFVFFSVLFFVVNMKLCTLPVM